MRDLPRVGVLVLCTGLPVSLPVACAGNAYLIQPESGMGYFDPHSHLSGVLPWPAYADLPAYINKLKGRGVTGADKRRFYAWLGNTWYRYRARFSYGPFSFVQPELGIGYFDPYNHLPGVLLWPAYIHRFQYKGVTGADKRRFYAWLGNKWYPKHRDEFGNRPYSSKLRFGLGARATLEIYPPQPDMDPAVLNGALGRIFTATPFTEFDSAYAFHGPAYTWLATTYYDGDRRALREALCTAQVLTLARTHITLSEQSISFIGGWGLGADGHSFKLQTILCAAHKPQELSATFARLGQAVPRIRIILMTHTDQLSQNAAGDAYKTWEYTGKCHWEPLAEELKLSPKQMYYALLGKNKQGKRIVPPGRQAAFFDTLVGIDTAAPEMTCFTEAGMAYYRRLVNAVYRAARTRRAMGWDGKLLVQTHVGEGFTVYYAKRPPKKPWTFASVFAQVPALVGNIVTNRQAPHDNISMLLDAVAQVRRSHPDLDRYVVIRFGDVTHATLQQARRMARLHVEADVNLDSNLATGSWPFAAMPDRQEIARRVSAAAADPQTNFALNDLPHFLLPDPHNEEAVAGVFGTHALKYLLMADVRVMLGTDGAGVEHASMPREYALAGSLIRYWKAHDPDFSREAAGVSKKTFFINAAWHLANMASNAPLPY